MPNTQQLLLEAFCVSFQDKSAKGVSLIGLEEEYPLVTCEGVAADAEISISLFAFLATKGFTIVRDSSTGAVVAAERPFNCSALSRGHRKIVVSMDAGHCTLEIALPPLARLTSAETELDQCLGLITTYLSTRNCFLLGYGIQPITHPSRNLMTDSARCVLPLRDDSAFATNFFMDRSEGFDFHFHTVSASSQCHLDVGEKKAVRAVNVLNALSGLQTAITANSPIWKGRRDDLGWKSVRTRIWKQGFAGMEPQIGIPQRFLNMDDYVTRISEFPPRLFRRDGEYLLLEWKDSFAELFAKNCLISGQSLHSKNVNVIATPEDIILHAGFVWYNARLHPRYGTVESRVSCQQPSSDAMLVPALALGLVENLDEAEDLVSAQPWDDWKAMNDIAARCGLEAQVDGIQIVSLVAQMVEIARRGLQMRGFGEDKYLEPADARLRSLSTPADRAIEIFDKEGITQFLESVRIGQ